ncbi:MAG: sugar transferase, partial [Chloroflexaceae bacterium]|nr:sugar transferase [Chloroflexaceae bacterium]
GYRLVGYLEDALDLPPPAPAAKRLGTIDDLQRVVRTQNIHQVIIALPFWQSAHMSDLVETCRSLGISFRIAPDLNTLSLDRVDVMQISGVPLLEFKEVSIQGWNLAIKRALDVGLVLAATPILLPLTLLIALLIRLDSRGPALFRQQRVGRHGKLFTCYKFRTMVVDAEARLLELAALNEADGPIFKMRKDPRITRIGRFLRRSSLDELPQLWNVLRGEMSLVGPRPALLAEVEQYAFWHRRRLEVTPGLTGLWQVLGRSNTTFDEMVRLDIYYAEHWSLRMDLRILLQTIPAVLLSRGAY